MTIKNLNPFKLLSAPIGCLNRLVRSKRPHDCDRDGHQWYSLDEMASTLSVLGDVSDIPSKCSKCDTCATVDFIHGEGLQNIRIQGSNTEIGQSDEQK